MTSFTCGNCGNTSSRSYGNCVRCRGSNWQRTNLLRVNCPPMPKVKTPREVSQIVKENCCGQLLDNKPSLVARIERLERENKALREQADEMDEAAINYEALLCRAFKAGQLIGDGYDDSDNLRLWLNYWSENQ